MPDRPGKRLAERFRASIDARNNEARRREEDRRIRQQRASEARSRLLADLAEFARAVRHFEVVGADDSLVLRFDGRAVRFECDGPEDLVLVKGDGLEDGARIFLNETLDRWVLALGRGGASEDQRLLFEAGLEHLLSRALGVEPVEASDRDELASSPPDRDRDPSTGGPGRTL